ncbi:MAG: hypothetical protein HRT72_08170, partial [Flavobacteriales bacterium]|nr:hypothetical protein [Flavobacteriales bacterium]
EEDGKKALFTGDGHCKDILEGLKQQKKLDSHGRIHVNVLKIQHHGAEANIDLEFCKDVTADHYIFCGNGGHENPEIPVVDLVVNSRLGNTDERSGNAEVGNRFKLWFSSSEANNHISDNKKHMKKLTDRVAHHASNSGGKMRYHFMKPNYASFVIDL